MISHKIPAALLVLLVCVIAAPAQVATDPGFTVAPVASNLSGLGKDMAIDFIGNTYVMGEPGPGSNGIITKIDRFGVVTPNFFSAGTTNLPGQLCTHPLDGQVYFALRLTTPTGPSGTKVWRIHPTIGPILHFTTNVTATGLAIDNFGNFYLGGYEGQNGLGIYRVNYTVSPGNYQLAVYLGPGAGLNDNLLTLVDGSLLIKDGLTIYRIANPASNMLVPFYTHTPPAGGLSVIHSMVRSPLNVHGKGVLIGVNDITGNIGVGKAFFREIDGTGPAAPAFTETFVLNGILATFGTRRLAARVTEEVLWYTHNASSLGAPASLIRITQTPSMSAPGSLIVSATSSLLTATIVGSTPGTPLHLGVALGFTYHPKAYMPYGILEVDPMNAHVIALADGTGIFGAPDGSNIGPNLSYTHLEPIPVEVPSNFPITLQAFILDSAGPNGLFYETNTAFVVVP